MSIYENFISNEQLKSIAETREMKYKLDRNEWIAQGKEEGETKKAIEDIIAFAKTGMSLTQICQTLNVSENIKNQGIKKLNEMGIKYNA